ncbi:syntaxin-5-like isoform X2 [Oscarella lobularis]|uniref:syntaxin-5-like isoform X2 n=1 Tax=Oscarella lobularis TaxID=121494 RepID=UPI003313DD09
MNSRDRTPEFFAVVSSLQARQSSTKPVLSRKQRHSEFSHIAKQIARDIGNTFAKLEKLTILAKRRSLFDDRPIEIQELTVIIKEDIATLNKQIAQLQQFVKNKHGHNGVQLQAHSSSVVVSLQTKLANMSKDFKSVLETRTESLKQQKQRRDEFAQSPISSSMPSSASALLRDDPAYHRGDVSIDMGMSGPTQAQMLEQQEKFIQERADAMQNIESTIVELGSIFQQLATMVKEQEEQVMRVDANVEDADMNVQAAQTEILKYFQSISSNRWLIVKIFIVLIIFFVIFVVFMT